MPKYRQIYAVYRGEQNLGDGTAEEIANKLKMKPKTIYTLASRPPAQQGKRLVVVKIGKEAINE